MRTKLTSLAAAVLVTGCTDGADIEQIGRDIIGTSVSSMEAPILAAKSADFRLDGPSGNKVSRPQPPRSFFFSGRPEPNENYFLREKRKAMIPDASRIVVNRRIRDYLHGIAQKLLAHAPDGAPEIQVHVLGSTSYEAFARENGDIYISINILATAASEDEIATLLGHEIAHVLLNHHDKDRLFQKQRDATTAAVGTALIASYFVALGESGKLANLDFKMTPAQQEELGQDALVMTAVKMGVDFVGNDIVNANWNRNQENEADLLGMDLAEAAGYDPYASFNSFARLAEGLENRKTRLDRVEDKAQRRTDALETRIKQGDIRLANFINTGLFIVADVAKAALGDLREFFAVRYQDPSKREERAGEYLEKFYPETAVEVDQNGFERIRRRLKAIPINEAYVKVEEALAALDRKEFAEGHKLIRAAYRTGPIAQDPFPRTVEAMLLDGMKKPRQAIGAYRKVPDSVPLPLEGYFHLAKIYVRRKNGGRALATLERAEAAYGAEPVRPMLIRQLQVLGRTNAAQRAYDECQSFTSPTKKKCKEAAKSVGLVVEKEEPGFLDGVLGRVTNDDGSATNPAEAQAETQAGGGGLGEGLLKKLLQ